MNPVHFSFLLLGTNPVRCCCWKSRDAPRSSNACRTVASPTPRHQTVRSIIARRPARYRVRPAPRIAADCRDAWATTTDCRTPNCPGRSRTAATRTARTPAAAGRRRRVLSSRRPGSWASTDGCRRAAVLAPRCANRQHACAVAAPAARGTRPLR